RPPSPCIANIVSASEDAYASRSRIRQAVRMSAGAILRKQPFVLRIRTYSHAVAFVLLSSLAASGAIASRTARLNRISNCRWERKKRGRSNIAASSPPHKIGGEDRRVPLGSLAHLHPTN